ALARARAAYRQSSARERDEPVDSRHRHSRSFFFFQAEDGIRYRNVTGVQTCALPIWREHMPMASPVWATSSWSPVSVLPATAARSEERRVGKEGSIGRPPEYQNRQPGWYDDDGGIDRRGSVGPHATTADPVENGVKNG